MKGLRVVNASVIPLMTRENLITGVYAMADRAVVSLGRLGKGII